MTKLDKIGGILFDLDGVLYTGSQVIEGACDTIHYLKQKDIQCRFITNTTTQTIKAIHNKLIQLGFEIERNEIFSPPLATVLYLRELGNPSCFLLLAEDAQEEFAEFKQTDQNPQLIVLGDIGNAWNYDILNKIFQMMMDGARLIALHKGRYWLTEDGLQMDIGAFVAGLEYVTSKQATIIGKPSKSFFDIALKDIGLPPQKVAMIGDDIVSDVGGAQNCGLMGILAKTGKFRDDYIAKSGVTPDLTLNSVKDLHNYF